MAGINLENLENNVYKLHYHQKIILEQAKIDKLIIDMNLKVWKNKGTILRNNSNHWVIMKKKMNTLDQKVLFKLLCN